MRRLTLLAGLAPAVVTVTAFPAAPAYAAAATVAVADDAYSSPAVSVTAGQTVTWQFTGSNPHSVTADGGAFDSHPACDLSSVASCATAGETFSFAFAQPGSYAYHCRIHGSAMAGTVTVGAVPTGLTVGRSARALTFGSRLRLTGTLTRSDNGATLAGRSVEVWRRRFGTTTWSRAATVTSGSGGVVSWLTVPGYSAYWQLRHRAGGVYAATASASLAVQVRVRLGVRLSATVLETGQSARFDARVSPAHPGATLRLQRYASGAWSTVQARRLSATSTASFVVRPLALGAHRYRLYQVADADHLGAATPAHRISVVRRTLRQGMSGADVLGLERRLAGLRYDVGAVDGAFSYDTTHAVHAFQKVNGLARTGVVDAATWTRLLGRPVVPALRHRRAGGWVEIDLTRQVLYYGRDGLLFRVVNVSTGSGQLYTVDGVTSRAVTPTGSFRVQRKIDGWRISRLGGLYRPAYFVGGYAVHGSLSVPPYPASHGCVRVTLPAMDRLYPMLPVGTPVFVYRS